MPNLVITEILTHNPKLDLAIVRLSLRYGVAQRPVVGRPYLPASTASTEGYPQFAQAARAYNRLIREGHSPCPR